ncbi:MAG: hypothetical protein ACJ76Y_09995 [Thermoanaerobaculia bacterium]
MHRPVEWPIDAELEIEDKITSVTKYTYTIQESITSIVASKLSQEVLSKIGSNLGVGVDKLEATISSEVQAKIGTELTESLQNSLSGTSTYSVETTTESGRKLKIKVSAQNGKPSTRLLYIYFKLRQFYWDIYLYRTDYLRLEYRKNLFWPDVRETIVKGEKLIQAPLFRVIYYEPVEDFSFKFDNYTPEVEDGDAVVTVALASKCPTRDLKPRSTMEALAKLAFPVSRPEKQAKKQDQIARRPQTYERGLGGLYRSAAPKKASPKRPAAKKMAAKKTAAKKAAAKKGA